jgi:hypothetical protein
VSTARVPHGLRPPQRSGLTPDELVERVRATGVRTSPQQMTHMLDELRAEGLAEDVHGRWRLTGDAQTRYGPVLRNLGV